MNVNNISLIDFIFLFGALQGLFLSLVLFLNKKGNKKANKYLSLLLFCISIIILDYFFSNNNLFEKSPHLIYISAPLWFCVGPLIYLYVTQFLSTSYTFTYKTLLHFLPFAIGLIILFDFYILPANIKLNYYKFSLEKGNESLLSTVWNYFTALQVIVYTFYSFKKINDYKKTYSQNYSGVHYIHINWLKIIFTIFIIYLIIDFPAANFLNFINREDLIPAYASASLFSLSTLTFVIAYFSINQPDKIFPDLSAEEKIFRIKITQNESVKKYSTSKLTEQNIQEYSNRLENFMQNSKPYLNSELKLKNLAESLDIPQHQLSQVINQKFDKNFYDYINFYRVTEAKNLLLESGIQNQTILAIAYEVGFSSSASFYRAFKKFTGITPTQFLSQNNIAEAV